MNWWYANPCHNGHVWIWSSNCTENPHPEQLCACGMIKWQDAKYHLEPRWYYWDDYWRHIRDSNLGIDADS